jgi:hypothetical protein
VTTEALTVLLAERVMHWRAFPGRFLIDGRSWLPKWRFQLTKDAARRGEWND